MKKSLIALAVLGAMSGAASAQSSVTIYGIFDIGVQWNEYGVATGVAASPYAQENVFGVESGYQSGSRFGLRGAEALGRGWSAVFTLEGGFDGSTGNLGQGGRVFGRQVWAGLQHNAMGTVVLGRVATPSSGTGSFDLWGSVDPFATGWGINSLGSTFIPSNALREDNSILWASPTWAGFKFAASYSFNINGAEVAPSGNNTKGMTLAGNWTWGPLFLAATYDVLSAGDQLTSPTFGNPDQKMTQLGGTFDFKIVKLHAAYAIQDNIRLLPAAGNPGIFNPTAGAPFDNNAWMVGVTVPLFGGSILGSYQYADADNITTATYSFEPDYSVWGVGYTYPFSRRTNMYIGYGKMEWDGNITTNGVSAGAAPSQRFDKQQFALGIRHLF
ncbi:MAG TPA: porin [Burkholderiaceae bacterium]|nr:porin [Burkholderiaceae bacterium]